MQIKVDEDLPQAVSNQLKQAGHDARTVVEQEILCSGKRFKKNVACLLQQIRDLRIFDLILPEPMPALSSCGQATMEFAQLLNCCRYCWSHILWKGSMAA